MKKFISNENLNSILVSFRDKILSLFYTKSEIDEKIKDTNPKLFLDKATYDKDNDNIVDISKEAKNIEGVHSAPLFSYYGKDKNGNIGFQEFPISVSKDDLNNYSATILDAKANNAYSIDLKDEKKDYALITQAYKFIEGGKDNVSIIKTFNNSESYNFIFNKDKISFENGMHIKNKYDLELSSNSDGLFESQVINKSDFLEINSIS